MQAVQFVASEESGYMTARFTQPTAGWSGNVATENRIADTEKVDDERYPIHR